MEGADTGGANGIDLVEWLAEHGVSYFVRDSSMADTAYKVVTAEDVRTNDTRLQVLALDLARSDDPRLRHALVALLLRHPEYRRQTEEIARNLPPGDPTGRFILLAIVVASALQNEWGFSLDIYLPDAPRIDAGALANELGLPAPEEEYGRPCLKAAAALLRSAQRFPYNFEEDWENAARRLLRQLALDRDADES